jgi:hypothetical protein
MVTAWAADGAAAGNYCLNLNPNPNPNLNPNLNPNPNLNLIQDAELKLRRAERCVVFLLVAILFATTGNS